MTSRTPSISMTVDACPRNVTRVPGSSGSALAGIVAMSLSMVLILGWPPAPVRQTKRRAPDCGTADVGRHRATRHAAERPPTGARPAADQGAVMTDEPVFLFIATYADPAGADEDYAAIKELHHDKVIGTYDIALVTKGENGKVHVKKHEKPTQHGAWGGVAVGAVLGLLFPPGILIGAAAGGLIGGADRPLLARHVAQGRARARRVHRRRRGRTGRGRRVQAPGHRREGDQEGRQADLPPDRHGLQGVREGDQGGRQGGGTTPERRSGGARIPDSGRWIPLSGRGYSRCTHRASPAMQR